MPHQCTKCSRFIPVGSKELLEGCGNCKSKFFFYIKEEQLEKIRNNPIEIPEDERKIVERDIRDIAGITDESMPVILDIESIRAIGSGKFEIDVVNLFNKDRPLIYKFEEGKYLIDLATTLRQNMKNQK